MNKLLITALALGSISLVACKSNEATATGDNMAQAEAPKAQTVSFAITGMT